MLPESGTFVIRRRTNEILVVLLAGEQQEMRVKGSEQRSRAWCWERLAPRGVGRAVGKLAWCEVLPS